MTMARTPIELVTHIRSLVSPDNVAGMVSYGISSVGTLGVPMPSFGRLLKSTGVTTSSRLSFGILESMRRGSTAGLSQVRLG